MNLSFRQMEYICAIADTGSYCAAAKKLYVTQPTLSIAVKNIEKSLGTPLFIRKKSEVVPTDEGTIVLTYARKILLLQKKWSANFIVSKWPISRGFALESTPF